MKTGQLSVYICVFMALLLFCPAIVAAVANDPQMFDYDSSVPMKPTVTLEVEGAQWTRYLVTYEVMGETVYATYFTPKGNGPFPAIVGIHGIFSPDRRDEWWIAEECAKRGIASLLPGLPNHQERKPAGSLISGQGFIGFDSATTVRNFKRAVIETRRGFDWLCSRKEIDTERLGIAGASLGAIISALTVKAEPRIKAAAFVVGGADLREVLTVSHNLMPELLRAAAALGLLNADAMTNGTDVVDPTNYPLTRGMPVLMFNGRTDDVFSVKNVAAFTGAFENAEHIWYGWGHIGPMQLFRSVLPLWLADKLGAGTQTHLFGCNVTEKLEWPVPGDKFVNLDLTFSGPECCTGEYRFSVPLVSDRVPVVVGTGSSLEAYKRRHPGRVCAYMRVPSMTGDVLACVFRYLQWSCIPDIFRCYVLAADERTGQPEAVRLSFDQILMMAISENPANNLDVLQERGISGERELADADETESDVIEQPPSNVEYADSGSRQANRLNLLGIIKAAAPVIEDSLGIDLGLTFFYIK